MPDPTGLLSHLNRQHRGMAWKEPCRVATTASITISTALNSGDTIDGVTLADGDRVLVKDQATGSQNGIYIAGTTPARAYDMDQDGTTSVVAEEIAGAFVWVIAGTANAQTLWFTTNVAGGTLGSTTITFSEFTGGGGTTITTKDEGSTLSSTVTTLDFTGAGVTASGGGATTTIDIPGGSGGALTLLSSNVLGSATADITVTGISGSYKDLIIVIKARGDTAASGIGLRMRVGNGSIDTGSNYAYARNYQGSTSGADASASDSFLNLGFIAAASSTAGAFGSVEISIRNYISASHWKGYSGTSWYGGTDATLSNILAGAWKNTSAAIDQVRIYVGTGNLDTGSSLYIYGRG
jgi:hypothetical protein